MRLTHLVPFLTGAAALADEKTPLTFSEFYGDVCRPKSKSYTWTGAVSRSATEKELNVPLNTYRGARDDDGDVITIKSLCNEGINCDSASEIQKQDKEIINRYALGDKQNLAGSSYLLSANLDIIAFRTKYEKQWRHSYKASYALFTTNYWDSIDGTNEPSFIGEIEDVWYFAFESSPITLDINDGSRRKFLYVDENKNIFSGEVGLDAKMTSSVLQLGDDATAENGIYNGVPDWVYEEEMLASRSAAWWSPNGDNIVFVKFNTKNETNVEYNYYAQSSDQAGRADDFVLSDNNDRYPQVERIPYSKPGGKIASYQVVFCSGLVDSQLKAPECEIIDEVDSLDHNELFVRVSFTNDVHLDQSNKNILSLFYVVTQNRIGSASSYLECYYGSENGLKCEPKTELDETTMVGDNFTGWVDSGAIMNDPFKSQAWLFRLAYKYDQCNSLEAFNKNDGSKKDLIDGDGVCIQSVHTIGRPVEGDELTTDYSILFYASVKGKSWERHLYQISYKSLVEDADNWQPIKLENWNCLTCKTYESRECSYGGLSLAKDRQFGMFSCYGPDVPYYLNFYMDLDGKVIVPGINSMDGYPLLDDTMESNAELIKDLESKKWPSVVYGTYNSGLFDIPYNFELYTPDGIDLLTAQKSSLPLLIEIYGGPGSTKVNSQWKRSYTQTYMASKHNMIIAAVDGRGSGRKGNKMMHATYKEGNSTQRRENFSIIDSYEQQIGQFEREDVSNFASYLMQRYPSIDSSRVGIWGWSFGGYATTHTLLYPGTVFTTGVAVAPLVSRFNYDSMHTERFMDLPHNNIDNYDKCSLLSQNISQMHDKQYTIISGTMDDNVHFQNAAQISKALFKENVQFNAMFYGDEAHSIRYGQGNNRHIYRVITRTFLKYFGLPDDEKDTWNL